MGGAVIVVEKTENLCLSMTVMMIEYSIHRSGGGSRYAKGDIDHAEYLRMKSDILPAT